MTRLYSTKPKAECRATLPIRDEPPYRMYTILRLKVPDLVPGEKVMVMAQFQASNPYQESVIMLSNMLTRGAIGKPDGSDGWTVIVPARRSGGNITMPGRHHEPRVLVGAFEVEEAGTDTVRVIAWASVVGNLDVVDPALIIDKGQGGISAIVLG